MRDKPSSKRAKIVATARCHFLALPPEIRVMIYGYAFSDELPYRIRPYGTTTRRENDLIHEAKASAKPKGSHKLRLTRRQTLTLARIFPLLLACNTILAEAMPILYKCHTFLLEMPCSTGWRHSSNIRFMYNGVEPYPLYEPLEVLAPYGRLITRLELENVVEVWRNTWKVETAPDFPRLIAIFPNLRFLRLNIKPVSVRDPRHANWTRFAAATQEIWDQLLARLDHLEFLIWHFGDEGISFREAIAPGPRWVQKMPAVAWHMNERNFFAAWRTVLKSVWSLQRSGMPKHVAHEVSSLPEASA